MLELSFNDIITNLHFAESTVLDKYMKDKSYMMQDLSKISFDSIWDSTLKIVSPFSSNLSNIITTWKKDIFMSIYTALLYESTPSINKTQLSEIISDKINYCGNPDTIRQTILKKLRELRNDIPADFLFQALQNKNPPLNYFLNMIKLEQPIKVFNEYNFYCYLRFLSDWPFYHTQKNGMTLNKWYATIESLFNELHFYDSTQGIMSFDIQFTDYIFEQLFYTSRFISILSDQWPVYCKYFYEIDDPIREQLILYFTKFAELPSHTLGLFSPKCSSIILECAKTGFKNPPKSFSNLLLNLGSLQYYYFPLCQTIVANLIYQWYSYLFTADINTKILEDLRNFIQNNINEFDYHNDISNSLHTFKNMKYPDKPKKDGAHTTDFPNKQQKDKPLTNNFPNNIPVESFGYNFTFYFYANIAPETYFDRCKNYNGLHLNKCIYKTSNPEKFIQNKINYLLTEANAITNNNTVNYLSSKYPEYIITPLDSLS